MKWWSFIPHHGKLVRHADLLFFKKINLICKLCDCPLWHITMLDSMWKGKEIYYAVAVTEIRVNSGFTSAGPKSEKAKDTGKGASLANTADVLKKIEVRFSSCSPSKLKKCHASFHLLQSFHLPSLLIVCGFGRTKPSTQGNWRDLNIVGWEIKKLHPTLLHHLPVNLPSVTYFFFYVSLLSP